MSDTSLEYIALQRSERFSPNSVEKDLEILQDVCHAIERQCNLQQPIRIVNEDDYCQRSPSARVCITMARSYKALQALQDKEQKGMLCINTPQSVMNCRRDRLDRLMRLHHIAMPPNDTGNGFWLKRGDGAAQSHADVVFAKDRLSLQQAISTFQRRGIESYVVSAHVKGDLVKFYGVKGLLFRTFYPTDDGVSKFGDERRNGAAHHYAYSLEALRQEVEKLAGLTGLAVYGGDAIIDAQGHFFIIDFNDWPSFSRCRNEAAQAIAEYITHTTNK